MKNGDWQDINKGNHITTTGDFEVEKVVYNDKEQRLYYNKESYFDNVSKEIWEFYIGGYQVLKQYLTGGRVNRKGKKLTLEEIENLQNTIKILHFTIEQMQKIEELDELYLK